MHSRATRPPLSPVCKTSSNKSYQALFVASLTLLVQTASIPCPWNACIWSLCLSIKWLHQFQPTPSAGKSPSGPYFSQMSSSACSLRHQRLNGKPCYALLRMYETKMSSLPHESHLLSALKSDIDCPPFAKLFKVQWFIWITFPVSWR